MDQNTISQEHLVSDEQNIFARNEGPIVADCSQSCPEMTLGNDAFPSKDSTVTSEVCNITENKGTCEEENSIKNIDECNKEIGLETLIAEIGNLKLQCQSLQQKHIEFESRLKDVEYKQVQTADESSPVANNLDTTVDPIIECESKIDVASIDNRSMRLIKDLLRLIHATCKHYKNVTTFEETSFRNLLENYGILRSVIEQYLKEYDITLIDPEEKTEFDPDLHNCVDLVSTTQEDEHGTIHTCVSLGYYNSKTDMVLTPAEVAVLKYKSEE